MDFDTESAPIAHPGSSPLQMSRSVLSATEGQSSEILCDSSKLDAPQEFDTHLGESVRAVEDLTGPRRGHLESKGTALFVFTQQPFSSVAWLLDDSHMNKAISQIISADLPGDIQSEQHSESPSTYRSESKITSLSNVSTGQEIG